MDRPSTVTGRNLGGSRLQAQRRLSHVCIAVVVVFAGCALRLGQLTMFPDARSSAQAQTQANRPETLAAPRGQMIDRSGHVVVMEVPAKNVIVNPRNVIEPQKAADVLASVLGVGRDTLASQLTMPNSQYQRVARRVSASQLTILTQLLKEQAKRSADLDDKPGKAPTAVERRAKALLNGIDLSLEGVSLEDDISYYYPNGDVGKQVYGLVGDEPNGGTGLQHRYDKVLRGVEGSQIRVVSSRSAEVAGGRQIIKQASPGSSVALTIDSLMQLQLEGSLKAGILNNSAAGGSGIIMDVKTGEILAMAGLRADASTGEVVPDDSFLPYRRNYQPGSVMKLVTLATAFDRGSVGPAQVMGVPARIHIGDFDFDDHDPHPTMGWTPRDILVNSSNVGAIMIAQATGREALAEGEQKFGFGELSGLDTSGEESGLLPERDTWSSTTLASLAIGYEVLATPVQVARAYAAIANGGIMVQPKLVKAVISPDGKSTPTPSTDGVRVSSESTAKTLVEMLTGVVDEGTGKNAQIEGFSVAGKTGTAKKVGGSEYRDGAYDASFVGFAPANDPQVLTLILLDTPAYSYGGAAAAPVFADVMSQVLVDLNIAPDREGGE